MCTLHLTSRASWDRLYCCYDFELNKQLRKLMCTSLAQSCYFYPRFSSRAASFSSLRYNIVVFGDKTFQKTVFILDLSNRVNKTLEKIHLHNIVAQYCSFLILFSFPEISMSRILVWFVRFSLSVLGI